MDSGSEQNEFLLHQLTLPNHSFESVAGMTLIVCPSGFKMMYDRNTKKVLLRPKDAVEFIAGMNDTLTVHQLIGPLEAWARKMIHNARIRIFLTTEESRRMSCHLEEMETQDAFEGLDEDSDDDSDADSWSKAWNEGLWKNVDLARVDVQTPFLAITVNREKFEDIPQLECRMAYLQNVEDPGNDHCIASQQAMRARAFGGNPTYWPSDTTDDDVVPLNPLIQNISEVKKALWDAGEAYLSEHLWNFRSVDAFSDACYTPFYERVREHLTEEQFEKLFLAHAQRVILTQLDLIASIFGELRDDDE
jgi:hypothetical protein